VGLLEPLEAGERVVGEARGSGVDEVRALARVATRMGGDAKCGVNHPALGPRVQGGSLRETGVVKEPRASRL
jgi:hypothetical protein